MKVEVFSFFCKAKFVIGWGKGVYILASCEYNFIRVYENLVQHPNNKTSILLLLNYANTGVNLLINSFHYMFYCMIIIHNINL